MKLKTEWYADVQHLKLGDLKVPDYYAKKEIEGANKDVLKQSIMDDGIKSPLVINAFPGREGIIIDGVSRYRIAKEFGITDVPIHFVDVPEVKEKQYHYAFSIAAKEYSIEEIIEQLRKPYSSYFYDEIVNENFNELFENATVVLKEKDEKVKERIHVCHIRLEEKYKDYPLQIQEKIGAKSKNEAIVKLIVAYIEGGIKL